MVISELVFVTLEFLGFFGIEVLAWFTNTSTYLVNITYQTKANIINTCYEFAESYNDKHKRHLFLRRRKKFQGKIMILYLQQKVSLLRYYDPKWRRWLNLTHLDFWTYNLIRIHNNSFTFDWNVKHLIFWGTVRYLGIEIIIFFNLFNQLDLNYQHI